MNFPKIMIAAAKSGSGKTTITCAFLKQLLSRGRHPVSFKCGPDYIDPMFHEKVLKIPSKNLDTFFSDAKQVRALYAMEQPGHDIAVLEGVMGLYDGLGGIREEGSSYHLAETMGVPIVLVVDAHGMGRSVIPLIAGFLQYDKKKLIRGVILNRTSKMFFDTIAPLIEEELSIKALGCFPNEKELSLGSRHLGLILPDEVDELNLQLEKAGQLLEKYVDVNAMIQIAEQGIEKDFYKQEILYPKTKYSAPNIQEKITEQSLEQIAYGHRKSAIQKKVRIAVAQDEAFCFYYRDNLKMLEYYGAELVPFSPLHDTELPENIQGLLLGGGYPELYAKELSENESMRRSIKAALEKKLPSLAECGGFMYLHEKLIDKEGNSFPVVGAIPAECHDTGKLVRFGYVELTVANRNEGSGDNEKTSEATDIAGFLQKNDKICAHEFHYFDSTDNGAACTATKPVTGRNWKCIHASLEHFWGFPHLYYPSNPEFVVRFIERMIRCR